MTKQQVLEKVIEKAVGNGYSDNGLIEYTIDPKNPYAPLIFEIDFAKSLWPTKYVCSDCGMDYQKVSDENPCRATTRHAYSIAGWQYHLQQLAISTDRIAYLEKFI